MLCWFVFPRNRDSGVSAAPSSNRNGDSPHKPLRVGHPTFASPHASPIAVHNGRVFVVNTPADTVDVIDSNTRKIIERINVGIDPVSVAVRPDGKEVWVSNHVSDSVSVIDNMPNSAAYLQVVATIQHFDPESKATTFDEPVGIAFASNDKAYVALSSENQIAVINVATREISNRLTIPAQDPRAIAVRGEKLYVIPFESNNKTQLSGGSKDDIDGDLVTFDAWEHSIRVNNVLSLGHVTDIVKHPDVPDRDLFVFDTNTDELVETVDTLGTLLYGLTVDSKGDVFIAQADARNDVNGRAGTKNHGIKELENRAFLNQITQVQFKDGSAQETKFIDLEPLPPQHPEKGQALATPFAIQISQDDLTLVVSAAGSDKLFTVDVDSGKVLGRISVGAVPRGITLENSADGKPKQAWVFNAVANTVSQVDLTDLTRPKVVGFVMLEDPTDRQVKLGRTWFNDADASSTGTFSCASCHPDGHTDQLLWVLKTPVVTGGEQIMPRSTMPIRGLRDTAPFHWDGIPGDPYGGNNSANIHGSDPPNSDINDPFSAPRHLIDGGLATTMLLEGDFTINDEGKSGLLSAAERDDMAAFLLSVPYPPAQKRPYTNVVSSKAQKGFKLFHIDGDNDPSKPRPNVCGNCHRMPFLVSTNTPGTGMDAPTWRGAYDRFLILPQGRLNIVEFDFYHRVAESGQSEEAIWRFSWGGRPRFNPVWDMVLEGSTGFSGTFGRQVTLNQDTVNDELTVDLMNVLEQAHREGGVVLEVDGTLIEERNSSPIALQFERRNYVRKDGDRAAFSREELISLAMRGDFVGTLTARHGAKDDIHHPQPAIWTLGSIEKQSGRQLFPILHADKHSITLSGRHLDEGASVIVDGRRVAGSVTLKEEEVIKVVLDILPEEGMHLLQFQNPAGRFTNDFIFHVAANAEAAAELQQRIDEPHTDNREALNAAVARGDRDQIGELLNNGARINGRHPEHGSTPLSTAAFFGRLEIVKLLVKKGANINGKNRDGGTPLHAAAFMCRTDVVEFLLERGASSEVKNSRGETPVDVVSGNWNQSLTELYTGLANATGLKPELERIQKTRPLISKRLRDHSPQEK